MSHRRLRTQHALVGGQRELRAVRERRHPPVEEAPAVAGDRVGAVEAVEPDRVAGERDGKRREQHGRGGQHRANLGESAPAQEQQREEGGRDDDHPVRPRERRGGAQQAGDPRLHHPRPAPPQQRRADGHQQQLEQRLGQDELLEVQQVGVEQDGSRGERARPAAHAEPLEEHVDEQRDHQADGVLRERHPRQPVRHVQEPQEHGIAHRVQLVGPKVLGVAQKALRVVDDERRLVGQRDLQAQSRPAGQQPEEQRVATPEGQAGRGRHAGLAP